MGIRKFYIPLTALAALALALCCTLTACDSPAPRGDEPAATDTAADTPADTAADDTAAPSDGAAEDTPDENGRTEDTPDEHGPAETGETGTAGENPLAGINTPLLIGIAAAVVIAAVIAVFGAVTVRKRRKPAPAADGTAAAPPYAVSNAVQGVQIANIQGIGSRESQQDSFGATDITDTRNGLLAVVADGMGGTANGAEISATVKTHMLQIFQSLKTAQYSPADLLLRMVSISQDAARGYIEKHGNAIGGSTVVAAIVKDGGLYFAAVGDSRICLLRGGALIQLNREHTCATELDERAARGEISLEAARSDPQRNALTSYIGVEGELQTDANKKPIPIVGGDRLLLMSDGVFGTLSEAEIAAAAGLPNVYEAGAALERGIKERNKPNQDNYTAILLAF